MDKAEQKKTCLTTLKMSHKTCKMIITNWLEMFYLLIIRLNSGSLIKGQHVKKQDNINFKFSKYIKLYKVAFNMRIF